MDVLNVVSRVLAGDRESYRAIVDEYGPCVRAFIAAQLADAHIIDDLAQETFIAAFESLSSFKPNADFKSWLKGIAHNKVLMHHRGVRQRGSALEKLRAMATKAVAHELRQCTDTDGGDVLDRLRACLEKLPLELNGAITARYYARESVQSISGRLGRSPSAVSSLLQRGRQLLAACIERGS